MPNLFIYSRIEFVLDVKDSDSDAIPLGVFAEWHDGHFWKVCLCAIERLKHEDFEPLDALSKELLEDPFAVLYQTANRYLKGKGWYQRDHVLDDFITKCFPCYLSIQAPNLFQQTLPPDESPEQIFEDIASTMGSTTRRAIWHRLDMPQLVPSQDNSLLLD